MKTLPMMRTPIDGFAELAQRLRDAVSMRSLINAQKTRYSRVINGSADPVMQADALGPAAQGTQNAKATRDAPDGSAQGHIALVGAGPGARDLLTLRAVERLQEADVIYYDRLVDPNVLELANPDAERVFVGKEVGACAWPQDRICALIVAEARKGRRVVRLKSGDPSIFGRATEELMAAREAGIPVEVVPGITAASAAAASTGRSLTDRGEIDTVILTTGQCKPGDCAPDWAGHVRGGTSLSIYMGVRSAERIRSELLKAGATAETPVEIACDVSTERERFLQTNIRSMHRTLAENSVTGTALITVRFPKSEAKSAAIAA